MPALKHVHSYKRRKVNPDFYFCTHPDCTHVMPRDMLVGKRHICYKCHLEMKLTSESLKLVNPWCRDKSCPKLNGRLEDPIMEMIMGVEKGE